MSAARWALRAFDRLTLLGIAIGIALELQPFWSDGLRVGFLVTIASIVLQIVAAHAVAATARE